MVQTVLVRDKQPAHQSDVPSVVNEIVGWAHGPVVQAGSVGEVRFYDRSGTWIPPLQLPASTSQFVAREAQLEELTALIEANTRDRIAVISAIVGSAGVGKTTLAVHWARQSADQFPDGQLYVDLRGFSPSDSVVAPERAVRCFLDALQVRPEQIPDSPDAQAGLYRTLLAGRKVLVVLDNARDADQVRPLLPGSPGCMVLVTSRDHLISLDVTAQPRRIFLDLLTRDEARQLLRCRIGHDRMVAEPEAVDEIINSCARLPLALSIVGARISARRGVALSDFAKELRDTRLDALSCGSAIANVRTVFSWSYQHLDRPAARMFRLLSVHPGPGISLRTAASLADVSIRRAQEALDELARSHLLVEQSPHRYAFHDLLREYSGELSRSHDSREERADSLDRIMDHYRHETHLAAQKMGFRADPIRLEKPIRAPISGGPENQVQAREWFAVEHQTLTAIIELAATSHHAHAWKLVWAMSQFYERSGYLHDWVKMLGIALKTAKNCGDKLGQAHAHQGFGRAYPWLANYRESYAHLRLALRLFKELDHLSAQAHTHLDIAWMLGRQDRCDDALPHIEQALTLSQNANSNLGEARALNLRGWYGALLDHENDDSVSHCEQAAALYLKAGEPHGQALAYYNLGYCHNLLGRNDHAIYYYALALDLLRSLGDRGAEADACVRLGDIFNAAGSHVTARHLWQQALGIHDELKTCQAPSRGFPNASQIKDRLIQLASQTTEKCRRRAR